MERKIVVAHDLGELWLGLIEDGKVVEVHLRPEAAGRWLGTIFKARVTRLAPGVRAAFVDGGLGRDLFLVRPDAIERDTPLAPGDELMVQIIREADGAKGHRVTASVTLAGWSLVLVPGTAHRGVSHRIEDLEERRRLREILDALEPHGVGLIARTAAAGAAADDLAVEFEALRARWAEVEARAAHERAPAIIQRGQEPALAFVRDHLAGGLTGIIVEAEAGGWIQEDLASLAEGVPRPTPHPGPLPLVEAYRLDRALDEALDHTVPLPGGGRLVIQQTEALTAIDVNSGRDVSAAALEETALRTNLEAAEESVRQVRLRDLAGLIVIDFIDMTQAEHRQRIDRALAEAFARDRRKVRLAPLSEFCVGEITRQRQRPALTRLLTRPCAHCTGGTELRPEVQARRLLRRLRGLSRPLPGGRFRVQAPAAVLDAVRRIAGSWGLRHGVPDLARIDLQAGPEKIDVVSVR